MSAPLTLPIVTGRLAELIPPEVLEGHLAVLGMTGSGKTSTAKLVVEQLVAEGERVCILDPIKSDWWGVTSSADGKSAGLPFPILGGPHGHVPLASSSGKVVGELVASGELALSILDMRRFEPGGWARFFTDFAQALLEHNQGVVNLVLEEAHAFAPKERSGLGHETMAVHQAKLLAQAGRSMGVRLILSTQRTQALHNALLGSCRTVIAHQLSLPADQAPVLSWLKGAAPKEMVGEISDSLASLPVGTAWVCSGAARFFRQVAFPRISTFDNTATPTAGARAKQGVAVAAVDIDQLVALLGGAEARVAAEDPEALKAEIARLHVQLAAKAAAPIAKASAAELEAAEKRGYDRGFSDGLLAGADRALTRVRHGLPMVRTVLEPAIEPEWLPSDHVVEQRAPMPPPSIAAEMAKSMDSRGSDGRSTGRRTPVPPATSLPASSTKMLEALGRWDGRPITWSEVALLSVLSPSGGNFNQAKKALIDAGLVRVAGSFVDVADVYRVPDFPLDAALITDAWAAKLGGSAARILRHLYVMAPTTKGEIAGSLGLSPKGGSWNASWKALRSNGLVLPLVGAGVDLAPVLSDLKAGQA